MTGAMNLMVGKALVYCAVVVVTVLWVGPASARNWAMNTLIHDSDDQNLCLNNPYQSPNNGNPLVVSAHCDYNDPGSAVMIEQRGDYVVIKFQTSVAGIPGAVKCMNDSGGVAENFRPIVLYDCDGGVEEMWRLTGDGEIQLVFNEHFCATVNTGNDNFDLYECLGAGNQKFVITKQAFTAADFQKCYQDQYAALSAGCAVGGAYFRGANGECYSLSANEARADCLADGIPDH